MTSVLTRRQFAQTTGSAAILTAAGTLRAQQKADSQETLRIGLVGCGGRGTGAASQALGADYNAKIVAMADIDDKQIETSINSLSQKYPDRVDVKPDKRFIGLDAYQKLIDCGVDVVLLASPPGFRPVHLMAAVDAGKHIFAEKPMAVDTIGYHLAMAAVKKAAEKKLNLVAGFCWRYSTSRKEAFSRIQDGQIGDVTSILATYHTGPVKPMPPASARTPEMSDVEWQIRNWYNFSWLSADSIAEQAVHSIDKICWAMGDKPPVSCIATGGRQIPSEGGNIYDHFHAAFEWGNGLMCHLANRQIKGCAGHNQDIIRGDKGVLIIGKGNAPFIDGPKRWRFRDEEKNMYDLEHEALFNAIRKGEVINDGDRMMLSTLVGIMGREAAYTGQLLTWQQMLDCTQDLAPDDLKWEDSFTPTPMPMPGVTQFQLPAPKKPEDQDQGKK
ncbi:putative dehydrogenase [Prosthecobacter fusiformis]|uniref:Putative dehydrogenase n=1 Tax=Prosthecobacter fusiformis TaxID=48464 RepID=A0A4R7SR93_9BACT|nr:Gfo/Idh/MocA family oxidoreductase [Prosthecobacter fusiformis]TDU81195.1 putative dehydrogenase [Prosthecobacter fusiformis]